MYQKWQILWSTAELLLFRSMTPFAIPFSKNEHFSMIYV